jgi:hypothetical protein
MSRKTEDLTNRKFGRLLVKTHQGKTNGASQWECVCDCGTICHVPHYRLTGLRTKSCGCLRRDVATDNLVDKVYGKLTVIKKYGYKYTEGKNRAIVWECQCECGNVHIVPTVLLKNGHVKSCGCLNKHRLIKDLTGLTFGELKVSKFSERKNNRTFWMCKCNCGNEKYIDGHHLTSGKQNSCGCMMGGWKHGLSKNKKAYYHYLMSDPVRKLRHMASRSIRKALKSKKEGSMIKYLPYTISELKLHLESLWEPWMSWNNYGGRPNDPKKTWWIDHIIPQSRFPYKSMNDPLFAECWKLSNLRPLEKIANISKGDK